MSIYRHYLQTAIDLLKEYRAPQPFALYVRSFFALHKKYGSRDRKKITALCYAYLRLCQVPQQSLDENGVLKAYWMLSDENDTIIASLLPERAADTSFPITEKAAMLDWPQSINAWFSFSEWIGALSQRPAFLYNLLIEQRVNLRVRPGWHNELKQRLENSPFEAKWLDESNISLSPNTPADKLVVINKQAVIQDYSSSRTGTIIKHYVTQVFGDKPISVWDTCAASGGKSIMMHDLLSVDALLVTDIRSGILKNLKQRFKEAGINSFTAQVMDVADTSPLTNIDFFDLVLCDVPCSGSGTWARTPEQIFSASQKSISSYTTLQKKIAANALKHVKANGLLIYITCSAFAAENEEQVKLLQQQGCQLLTAQYIEGAEYECDTMYIAIIQRM